MSEPSASAALQDALYGQLVAKVWMDPDFRARLYANPTAVVEEAGFPQPPGRAITVLENAPPQMYLVVPPPAPAREHAGELGPWDAVVNRAAADPAFRAQLVAEPARTLTDAGIDVAPGTVLRVVEPNASQGYLILPPRPADLPTDAEIDAEVVGYACTNLTCLSMCQYNALQRPLGTAVAFHPVVAGLTWSAPTLLPR